MPLRPAAMFSAALRNGASVLLVSAILTGVGFYTRAESPSFKVYTTEDGLAHDFVNKIVRDSRGFLWFCTSEGLSRFDGSRFTNFTTEQGLPHRNITDFYETRNGTYLVATSYGVSIFDPAGTAYPWNVIEQRLEQSSIEPPMFRTFAPDREMRPAKSIRALAEGADGKIWAGTNYGLYRATLSEAGLSFEEVTVADGAPAGFYNFLDDGKGGMITVGSNGVYRIYDGKVELQDPIGAGSIMKAADGRFWIGASGAPTGIRIYELKDGHLNLVERFTTKDGLLSDIFQNAIWQLKDGTIFVGMAHGFQQFAPNGKSGSKFRTLSKDIVLALTEDSVGNLWLGTELKGAWQLLRSGFVSFGEKDGVAESEDIRSIYVNAGGNIFLTTRPNRILRLDNDGIFRPFFPYGVSERSWGWTHLDFESHDGEWWVPGKDGLRRYPKVARPEDIAHLPPKRIYTTKDGLHGNEIFILFEDSRGDIWITTDPGGGVDTLSRWDQKSDSVVAYSSDEGLPQNSGAVSYAEDREGSIWFGFFYGGIARYKDGKFRMFTAKDGFGESMPGTLYVDTTGRLWIGTTGQGLYRVDDPSAETPVFVNMSTRNGLSSNQVICLTEDRLGHIYAGTGRGISRIDANERIEIFTQADGLPSNYITRCAADKNGTLWFVSQNTLVRYDPVQVQTAVPDTIYIDRVSINGNPQKISALGETAIDLPELSSDQNQVQINFFALTFGSGENIKYQYRLDDQEWSQPTDEQTVNLNLTPDKHSFTVRAVRADGTASANPAVLSLRILPPIWQRWWFVSILVFVAAGLVLLVYGYRINNLRRINAALREANLAEEALRRSRDQRVAELEQVRSRIATDLHDDIGASLTQIAVLSEVAQAQAGKGNGGPPEELQKISSVSSELIGTMSDIVWAINPAKDHLSDMTQRMRRVASDLLSPKGITVHFRSRERDRRTTIKSNAKREVFLIFKESINNIAKHSGAINVEIDIEITDAVLNMRIQDDGKGFEIGAPSFEDTFSSEGPSGNGLRNMRKRAAEMQGYFDIDSAPGRGTVSVLTMPLDGSVDKTVEPQRPV